MEHLIARRDAANLKAIVRQWCLLRTHATTLMHAAEALASVPAWSHARIADASIQLAYIGGAPITLGLLVEGWAAGWLLCDGRLVFSAGGSPLSGRHILHALEGNDRVTLQSPGWTRRGVEGLRRAHARSGESALGPDCVLAELGVAVDPVGLYAPDGVLLTNWSPEDKTLLGEPVQTINCGSHKDIWESNRRVLASISPLRSGVWRGSRFVTPEGVIAHPGWLEGPDGGLLAWTDRPLPPRAVAAAARTLLRESPT